MLYKHWLVAEYNNSNNDNYFQNEISLTDRWDYNSLHGVRLWKKLVSYLYSCLHFIWTGLCRAVSRHFTIWLFQISACFVSQPFLLTLLYLTCIFDEADGETCTFSILYFTVLEGTQAVPAILHLLTFLLMLFVVFSGSLLCLKALNFPSKVSMLSGASQNNTPKGPEGYIPFSLCHMNMRRAQPVVMPKQCLWKKQAFP